MRNFSTLNPVIKLKRHKRDRLLRVLVNATVQRDQALSCLSDLQTFLESSDEQWTALSSTVRNVQILQESTRFRVRLMDAVAMQQSKLAHCETLLMQAREDVVQVEQQLQALEKLLALRRAEQQLQVWRKDQRAVDEWATLGWSRHARSVVTGSLQ